MIGRLIGTIVEKEPPMLLIDVNGVGYEVLASITTISSLPVEGSKASLFIHTQTREDGTYLYGFAEKEERWVFRELIKISGVGPKLALAILSGMSVPELGQCIVDREVDRLVKLPGVGKKTAERLVVELQGRLEKNSFAFSQLLMSSSSSINKNVGVVEAIGALIALGYKEAQAKSAVDKVFDESLGRDDIIKLALKRLAG